MERSLGHRAPVLWLLLPTMGGFALARALPPGWGGAGWLLLAVCGAAWAWAGCRRGDAVGGWWWRVGLVVAVGAVACAYFQRREHRSAVWEQLPAREAELVVQVDRVFPAAPGRFTTTGLGRIAAAPAVLADTVGQRLYLSLQLPRGVELLPSVRVRANGVLTPLRRDARDGFDGYLASDGVAFKFQRARWLGEERPPRAFRRFCAAAARRFESSLGRGLEDQPALRSIHVAMLLGSRAELSETQRELFMNSGTMHLFAISGLHIAVIWAVLSGLLGVLRVPRPVAVVAGLAALLLYVQITGGAPSAQRAWLMIAFVLAGKSLRWTRNALAGIAGSALAALWWDPWQLFGLGFQMSYAVVAALLLYGLPLEEYWQQRWRPWSARPPADWGWWRHRIRWLGRQVISGGALAVAATLVSLPMTLASFGLMTPGALVVNLVCIPASSLAIVAGMASILAGLLGLAPLCVLFNHASALTIAALERGLALAMQVPGMYWTAGFRADGVGAAVLVAMLLLLGLGYAGRWRRKVGGFWGPVVGLLVALALLARHGAPADPTGSEAANLPGATPAAIAAP